MKTTGTWKLLENSGFEYDVKLKALKGMCCRQILEFKVKVDLLYDVDYINQIL